jgi:predicted ATP-grasp superfamily ATP-dependent carboligase
MSELKMTPVVVLGCFRHGGLAVVRSLGRLGAPVYAVHRDRASPAFFSRYCRERILWDIDAAAPEASVQFLKELSGRIGRRAILIAMSDLGAMFVADYADRLGEWFDFPDQDRNVIRSLCSKKEMYYLAKKWNVPTPETSFPRSRIDVENFLETARFPVLLKPITSGPSASPMRLAPTKDDLLQCYDSIEDPSTANLMIQEYIPGGDEMTWTFNGYFDRAGECDVAFTGRKLRNYPPYFGQASLGVCARNERVKKTTIEFMKAIGYRGPLDLGYRYDARDDRYKVNDINPRIGAMFRCFVGANGMDVARALYQDMTGQQVLPATTQEGRKWIVEDRDWISALRYYRDGKLTFRGWRQSLRGVQETSFIAKDDLWPIVGVFVMVVHAAWNRFKGFFSRRRAGRYRRIGKVWTVS